MKFENLKEFDEIYTNESSSKLLGIKEGLIYELNCGDRNAELLPQGDLWYDNKTVTDGEYLYWYTQGTLFCVEMYGEEDYVYSLDLVKYGDCFYDFKIEDFLKLNYSKDVIRYIVKDNGYTMSLDGGDTEIIFDNSEYKIIHHSFWSEKINDI